MTLKRDLGHKSPEEVTRKALKVSKEENLSDTSLTSLDSKMNFSDDMDNTMQDIDEMTVKPGTSGKLEPVKILIEDEVIEKYRNNYSIRKELIKIFEKKINMEKIKFIIPYGKKITIVTDDIETRNVLNNQTNWNEQSFGKGIKIINSTIKQNFKISLRVHPSIEIEGEFTEDLQQQGIINPIRRFNKNNAPTNMVHAEIKDYSQKENLLRNGIKCCYTKFEVTPRYSIKQCFKCFKVGHLKRECKESQQICLKCGKDHHSNNCRETEAKCINCGLDHVAVSRKCNFLKGPIETKGTTREQRNANHRSFAAIASKGTQNQINNHDLTELIKKVVLEMFNNNEIFSLLKDFIQNSVQEEISKMNQFGRKEASQFFPRSFQAPQSPLNRQRSPEGSENIIPPSKTAKICPAKSSNTTKNQRK